MGRKKAREGAMSLVYKMEMNQEFSTRMTEDFFRSFDCFEYTDSESNYINDASNRIIDNLEVIDGLISNNLKGWRIDRLAKVDLSVLRVAVFEILYREDIPIEVSVNEAIETVKKYSDGKSYKFINGVLGGVIKDIKEE